MIAKFMPITSVAALTFFVQLEAVAAPIDLTWVGTWTNAPGSGNSTGSGGPGMSSGQRYVINITYDDASTVTNDVDVLNGSFLPSGNKMTTINLDAAGNSLDIFVPMEGLDTGTPFIYNQNETNHFPAFIPNPTLNFVNGSSISNTANIIGLEFEGNFFAGAGNNLIEIFNTSPGGGTVNLVSQILNFGTGIAISGVNSTISNAVDLEITAGSVIYSAGALTRTTSLSIDQSNDLGAGRFDGEDFIDAFWSPTGTTVGNDIQVGIANSGLANTTSTASWTALLTEQMTGVSDTDSAIVSYANAAPTLNASTTVQAGGIDFSQTSGDFDLAVNALIADFETITNAVLLDGTTDVTAFFADLWNTGSQSSSYSALEAAFGLGLHTLDFSVTDFAGVTVTRSQVIEVLSGGEPPTPPLPAPAPLLPLIGGLIGLHLSRRSRP